MAENQTSSSQRLADWIAASQLADIPAPVIHQALRSFVNIMGCTLGGSGHEIIPPVENALRPFAGAPTSSLIGRGQKTDMLQATLLNCVASGVHTFDDTHAEAVVHPSGPVVAALLALAETRGRSGSEVLLAFLLGVETLCRLGKAFGVPPAKGNMSWLQTVICAPVAIALAAGKLMRLDRQHLIWAIGIAAAASSGMRSSSGSMWSRILPGEAAQLGLKAALLAEHAVTSGENSIEGKHGMTTLLSHSANLPALDEELGSRWEILKNTFKPYPSGVVIAPVIDASLELHAKRRFTGDDIAAIHVRVNPVALALTDRPRPRDTLQAQVSLQHWAAIVLVDGAAGLEQIETARIHDPEIVALRGKVTTASDPSVPVSGADTTVTLTDGTAHTASVKDCLGSPGHPMTDADVNRKFHSLARLVLNREQAETLLQNCWRLAELSDIAAITSGARPR